MTILRVLFLCVTPVRKCMRFFNDKFRHLYLHLSLSLSPFLSPSLSLSLYLDVFLDCIYYNKTFLSLSHYITHTFSKFTHKSEMLIALVGVDEELSCLK